MIKEGSNVSIVVDSIQKISTNKKWYALDSLYLRPSFSEKITYYENEVYPGFVGKVWSRFILDTATVNVVKNPSDSIGFMIDAKEDGGVIIRAQWWEDTVYVTKGINFVTFPKERTKDLEYTDIEYSLYGKVNKFKIYLHLK